MKKILLSTFILAMFAFACNGQVLCAVGDFENETFSLPQKSDRSTNVQLTTSSPIAQNTCYGLPFQDNALGGLCKTHN
jgi:hypothetical protein